MFEFQIVKKYLIPRRKQLSISLIALLSLVVVSLVVWLLLVFLSVTNGIEKSWLKKLTSLNAPITITPTNQYYHSYYYLIDSISSASNYATKNLQEKFLSSKTDPYLPEEDPSLPSHWSNKILDQEGNPKDLVKDLYASIEKLKDRFPSLVAQDFEITGALIRLKLIRSDEPSLVSFGQDRQSFLTQMIYVASLPDKSPYFSSLLLPPSKQDLSHLIYLSTLGFSSTMQDEMEKTYALHPDLLKTRLKNLLQFMQVKSIKTPFSPYEIPRDILSNHTFDAYASYSENRITHFLLPSKKNTSSHVNTFLKKGKLTKKDQTLVFTAASSIESIDASNTPIYLMDSIECSASIDESSFPLLHLAHDLKFLIKGTLQGYPIQGKIKASRLQLAEAESTRELDNTPRSVTPPWLYFTKDHEQVLSHLPSGQDSGTLLPKNFQDIGVRIGDRGYLAYNVATPTSTQEQRLPIFVAGFYDPGIMSVGAKCILLESNVVRDIASGAQTLMTDPLMSNGLHLWFDSLKETKQVKDALINNLDQAGLSSYFEIKSYDEYDYAKDLLQQFQSDKYLFTLIALIILIVACSNIISFLVLMVQEKKKEIGILQSMGATSKSIALIFASCGAFVGLIGCGLGILGAIFTMRHIDSLVSFLSFIQGHDAFNAQFYGGSLPKDLSTDALLFILIATPILSIVAGAIPAIKACRLKPTDILRSQS